MNDLKLISSISAGGISDGELFECKVLKDNKIVNCDIEKYNGDLTDIPKWRRAYSSSLSENEAYEVLKQASSLIKQSGFEVNNKEYLYTDDNDLIDRISNYNKEFYDKSFDFVLSEKDKELSL